MTPSEAWHALQRVGLRRSPRARRSARALAGPAFALLGASVGCGDADPSSANGESEDGLTALPRGSICPSCERADVAGNETSDFSGSWPACALDRAALPTDPDALAAVDQLRQAYAGALTLSLRWSVREPLPGTTSPFSTAAPTGYEPATQVSVDVVLGETEYYVGRPYITDDPVNCPDGFRVPATLYIATADGAFEVEARGSFTTLSSSLNHLRAHADLADAVGSLDLRLPPDRPHHGSLLVQIFALNEGKRGALELSLALDDPTTYAHLDATFPDDGCDFAHGFPVDADTPLPAWDGASAAQLLSDWQAALAPQRVPAVWADCTPVDLQFELGQPTGVCAGSSRTPAYRELRFDAENRLFSSDGRLDTIVPRGLITSNQLTTDQLFLRTSEPPVQLPPDELAATAGVHGVDPGNSPWLTTGISGSFVRAGGDIISASGLLRVEGLDCTPEECAYRYRETLDWPRDSSWAPYCE